MVGQAKTKNQPQLLIIAGHPRSGTTLLLQLCNAHPSIAMTGEFKAFAKLGNRYLAYKDGLKLWVGDQSFLLNSADPDEQQKALRLFSRTVMWKSLGRRVTAEHVRAGYAKIFPDIPIVGDKYPDYMIKLDKLCRVDNMTRVIIYRDGRDVAQSVLERIRGDWQDKKFGKKIDTAAKIARHWVDAINTMQAYAPYLHIIRYEDLVVKPREVLGELATHLAIDPTGFPYDTISSASLGKYREGLAADDLKAFMAIAEPTLAKLGYV